MTRRVGLRTAPHCATFSCPAASVSLDKVADGFAITKSHLDLVAHIPGADRAKFDSAVKAAETGCPVSKLFKAEISVTARLNP
jgi:osmotically inducible protein OsmC